MAKEYKVLSITEMVRPSDAGGVEKFYRHRIRTAGGTVFHVDISDSNWSTEKAAPILLDKAIEADKILKL